MGGARLHTLGLGWAGLGWAGAVCGRRGQSCYPLTNTFREGALSREGVQMGVVRTNPPCVETAARPVQHTTYNTRHNMQHATHSNTRNVPRSCNDSMCVGVFQIGMS